MNASPLLDGTGGVAGVVVVLRDLAAQRRMETELAIASTRLEGLLEASGARRGRWTSPAMSPSGGPAATGRPSG